MKKSLLSIALTVLVLGFVTSCGNEPTANLCYFEYNCASTAWCYRGGHTNGGCMSPHEGHYNSCLVALDNIWYATSGCTDLYNKLFNCITRHVACTDAQDVYLNRLHSVEQNECRNEYYKLLEECAGL